MRRIFLLETIECFWRALLLTLTLWVLSLKIEFGWFNYLILSGSGIAWVMKPILYTFFEVKEDIEIRRKLKEIEDDK